MARRRLRRLGHARLRRAQPAAVLSFAVGDLRALDWWERLLRGSATRNVQIAIENVMRQMDVRAVLPAIGVPTLLLHRVGDCVEDVGASRYLAEAIRGAILVELDGADHFPWAGDQEQVLREIERFLRGIAAESASVSNCVLASVLVTDIVDSTAMRRRSGTANGGRRGRHTTESSAVSSRVSADGR